MRRITNTYPGDIVKYPTKRGTFPIGAADEGSKVLFYNETPVNLDLDFYNGSTDVLHAWEANFWTLDGEVGDITWAIDADSLTVTNPPINAVFATIYNPNEKLNDKAYPMPLIRQIGGQQAIVSSASQTINDGNALQQVVEATLQGHGSSDVIINNDGSFTLKGAGLIAAVGILTHILGTLTVDQVTTLTGDVTLGGKINGPAAANIIANTAAGKQFEVDVNNVLAMAVDGGGLNIASKKIFDTSANNLADWTGSGFFQKGNASNHGSMRYQGDTLNNDWQMGALSTFTGSGTGTYNHTMVRFGVSAGPNFIAPIVTVSGSATQGYDTITSTQTHITLGAVLAFKGWCYLV